MQPSVDSERHTSMLTRRNMLQAVGLAGTAVAVPTVLTGCGDSKSDQAEIPTLARAKVPRAIGGSGSVPSAVTAVTAFTADLYQKLARHSGNVVCSPYSVMIALAMTRNGAAGKTAAEMDTVLHAPELSRLNEGLNALTRLVESRAGEQRNSEGSKAIISMDVANSLWGQRGVAWEAAFLEALSRYYGTGMRLVDYERGAEPARLAINAWTSDRTHGKIPNLLPPRTLDELTRLVLVNAIYLKASWDSPFDKLFTEARPFMLADGTRITPDTMRSTFSAAVTESAEWRGVRLSYAGGQLAMTIVVPTSSLADLEASLDAETLRAMLSSTSQPEDVMVTLPRWSFRLASPLADVLEALGMPTAFDRSTADFTGMTHQEELFIGAVQHEAFISVDEDGTEAAAATAVIINGSSAPARPPSFVVDRPFLFVIHDVDTATPLFIGRVSDPTAT